MGHSAEVEKINALRDEGYFVRVVRRRPIELTLALVDEDHPDVRRIERLAQSRSYYLRSELEAIRALDGVERCVFSGHGGTTIVKVEDEEGIVAIGEADCRDNESFSKKQGLRMALGRAELQMGRLAGARSQGRGYERPINADVDSDRLHAALAHEVAMGRA